VGVIYRARQFWHTVFLQVDLQRRQQAQGYLAPTQWDLFARLQPVEQEHAVRMLHMLLEQGENQPDLLVAALLHDVGKLHYPLNPVERAVVVLGQALFPAAARRWGRLAVDGWDSLPGWRKAFVLAEQHAEWGARLAQQAGVSSLAESLIRHHHHPPKSSGVELEQVLQYKLWVIDNKS
jgi:hypothetical protein